MPSNVCIGILDTTLKQIHERLKTLSKKLPKGVKQDIDSILENYKDSVTIENVADLTDEALENISINLKQDVLKVIDSARAADENVRFVTEQLKLRFTKKEGIVEKIRNVMQRAKNLVNKEHIWYTRAIKQGFDNLYQRGDIDEITAKKAYKAFLSHISGGRKLIKLLSDHGLDSESAINREIWKALKQGHYTQDDPKRSIPVLHAIGKVFRDIDDHVIARMQKNGTPFEGLEGHVVKIAENRARLLKRGFDSYRALLLEVVDWESISKKIKDNDIEEWIKNRWDEKTEGSSFSVPTKKSSRFNLSREIVFNGEVSELKYYNAVAEEGQDILRAAFSHRQTLLGQSKLYELFGPNRNATLETIAKTFSDDASVKAILGKDSLRFVENNVVTAAEDARVMRNSTSPVSETAGAWYRILSNASSGYLTGWSGLRNILYDNTYHPAWQAANLKGTSFLAEYANAWSRQISGLVNQKKTTELANLLEDMGISINISTNKLTQGITDQEQIYRLNRAEQLSHNFAEATGSLSLGDASFKAARTMQSQHVSSILERAFQGTWEDLDPIIRRYFIEAGVTASQFGSLKKLPKIKYDGSVVGLDFKKAKADKLETFQSTKQNISRLEDAYVNLHTNMLNDLITVKTLRGSVSESVRIKHPIEQLVYKFWGMPLSQYRSLLRTTRLAAGLEPDAGDILGLAELATTGAGAAKLGTFMLTAPNAGIMYMWTRDLLEGREPRDVTPHVLAQSLAFTGMGGMAALIAPGCVLQLRHYRFSSRYCSR